MSRNDLRLVVHQLECGVGRGNHPVDRAAAPDVDERVAPGEVRIAHVHHVRVPEMDDHVSVGVRVRDMEHVDLVAVQVEGHRLTERDDRQRVLGRRRNPPVERLHELLHTHPLAYVVVRHDERARLAQVLVPASMVTVPMRVEHEPDRAVSELAYRSDDAFGQRRVLVVDEKNAVGPGRDPNVPSTTDEHVNPGSEIDRLDLDGFLGGERCGGSEYSEANEGTHPTSSSTMERWNVWNDDGTRA